MNKDEIQTIETELYEWIKGLGFEVIRNYMCSCDNKTEITICIPSKNLGIEINSLSLHSDKYLKKNYHAKKRAIARIENIRLIQITDKQWKEKNEICKSIILNALGLSLQINVQDCTIECLKNATDEITTFFERSHMDGFTEGSDYIILRYEGEITAGLIIGQSWVHKEGQTEVLRYANTNGIEVQGAFDCLVKEYRKANSEPLFSYLNLSLFAMPTFNNGSKWFFKGYTDAGYILTNGTDIISQSKTTAMDGYYRYYDCGEAIYENVE